MKQTLLALLMCITLTAQGQFLDARNVDHQLHFSAGVASGEFGSLLNKSTINWDCDVCARGIFGLLVGVGKETWDATQPNGKFDLGEATATTLGSLASKIGYYLADLFNIPKEFAIALNIIIPILHMGKVTLNL